MNQALEASLPQRGRLNSCLRLGLGSAILFLLVTIVYWPTLDAGFGDSADYIEHNPALRTLHGLASIWLKPETTNQYMPVVFSTFWGEYQLWAADPIGYHVVSLVLHALTAVLVWRLLAKLEIPGAWLAAAIFAVHPVQVDAIAVLHQRKKVLTCFFALASLLAYLRFSPPERPAATNGLAPVRRDRWGYYSLAFVLYVGSLLCNAETAFGPAVLLVIYWWKRGRLAWREVVQTVPFFLIGWVVYGATIWREMALIADSGQSWGFSLLERVLLAGRIVWFYAGKLAWPQRLMAVYPQWVIDSRQWWQYLFPIGALAVVIMLWALRSRIGRGPLAAVLIFVILLAPGLGFIDFFVFQITFVGDHFQYHACIALVALAAALAVTLGASIPSRVRWFEFLAAGGLLAALAIISHQRTFVFADEATMAADELAKMPPSWQRHFALGTLLQQEAKYDDALPELRQAIELDEQLVRSYPTRGIYRHDLAFLHMGMGALQHQAGQIAEWERSLRAAVDIQERLVHDHPTVRKYQDELAKGYVNLYRVRREIGESDESASLLHKAIEIRQGLAHENPSVGKLQNDLAMSYGDLGILYRNTRQPGEAEDALRKAIDIRERLVRDYPTVAEYQSGLAASYEDLAAALQIGGKGHEALQARRKAIAIREKLMEEPAELTVPKLVDEIETRQSLADDELAMNEHRDDLAASYVDVGLLQRQLGQPAEAEDALHKAIDIRQKLSQEQSSAGHFAAGLAWCYSDLALVQRDSGRPLEAAASRRKAIEVREQLARKNPDAPEYANELAGTYVDAGLLARDMGQPEEAQKNLRKAIEIRESLVRDHSAVSRYQEGLAWCYAHLAAAQYQASQIPAAEDSCRKVLEIRENLVAENPERTDYQRQLAFAYRDLGNLQQATGRIDEAAAAYRGAIAVREWLVREHPDDTAEAANLTSDLKLAAEMLALLGNWNKSAELYAQAAKAGDTSWQTLESLALVQFAAGNDAGYKHACADLLTRYSDNATPEAAFSIAWTAVLGEQAPPDASQALALARRVAVAAPENPITQIVLGAAQYRAGRPQEAIAALSKLETAGATEMVPAGRLLGAMFLALAYHNQQDNDELRKQLETLPKLIDQAASSSAALPGGLPPWATRCTAEAAKRALAKLNTPPELTPLGS